MTAVRPILLFSAMAALALAAPSQDSREGKTFTGAKLLMVEFETTPDAVRKALPSPLEPADKPLGLAFVADYPKTSFGSAYHEGAVFLLARYGKHEGWHCLAMPVDDRRARVLGRAIGYPKEMGEITLKRDGDRMRGKVRYGQDELIVIEATLEKEGRAPETLGGRPHLNLTPLGGPRTLLKFDIPVDVHKCETGRAELRLAASKAYPLAEIPVVKVLGVIYVEQDMGDSRKSSVQRVPIDK